MYSFTSTATTTTTTFLLFSLHYPHQEHTPIVCPKPPPPPMCHILHRLPPTQTHFYCFPFTTTTNTTITFLLVFLLHHLHIIYPTLTLYWPYIAPHINPTSTLHRSNNKKRRRRRRRGNITESSRINYFFITVRRSYDQKQTCLWYFLFAAHRFVLQTHRHQLCYETLAPAHWLFTRLWTLGSQNMEVLQKSVY